MSEIKAKLQSDIKEAMKARNSVLLETLRGLSAAIKQVEIDTRTEPTDAQVLEILQKEVKKRRDTIKFAKEGGREDIAAGAEAEIEMISQYVGKSLSDEELKDLITKAVADGADNIGKIMGVLNKDYKGRFDGRLASELIKSALG